MNLCRVCNRYAVSLNNEGKCRKCAQKDKNVRRFEEFNRRGNGLVGIFIRKS